MKKETRTVVYDDELRIEAYCFEGIVQPFPNHFHEYYVIGFVEDGHRALSCKNKDYSIECGNVVLFNPGDNHGCIQSDDGTFDYRGFNISTSIMLDLAEEVTGKRNFPDFRKMLFMIPTLFFFDFQPGLSRFTDMTYLFNILYLGLGASALCFVTWNFAVKELGAVKTSVYIYMVPVITVITSVIILHEKLTLLAGIGTVLTLIGLFLSEYKPERNRIKNGFTK